MLSELSFLIELLLNHPLSKETKDMVAARIREVEAALSSRPQTPMQVSWQPPAGLQQAASTLAAMARHGDIPAVSLAPVMPAPEPVAVIAQTPQATAAMNSRNEAINQALAGKVDKVTGRPRKF